MATRTRTFTGTLPSAETPEGQPVLVHLFEESTDEGVTWTQVGMEVAVKEGEGRFARWGLPAAMTEEI